LVSAVPALLFFFFQAEDGIRDWSVTGVQTCALPISNSTTGADDLYWYVPAASPIKSIKDAAGKTIAYSTAGSSTNLAVLAFIRQFGVDMKPVATGSPASTFTQTMSGQIHIGWSSPP